MDTYHPSHHPNTKLLIFLGFLTSVLGIAVLIILARLWTHPYTESWQVVSATLAVGPGLGVTHGLYLGFGKWFLFWLCSYVGAVSVLVTYPALVEGHSRLEKFAYFGGFLKRIRARAIALAQRMGGLGPIGLMLFVCIPVWNTGPIVGAYLGYLFGIRTWLVFVSVVVGNTLSVAGWVWLLAIIERVLQRYGYEKMPWFVPAGALALCVLAAVGYKALTWWSARRTSVLPVLPAKPVPETGD
ncbi:MAG: hypothetical protein AMXMBFR84_50630 [Candidatus Hydrogenedentota bacterium]